MKLAVAVQAAKTFEGKLMRLFQTFLYMIMLFGTSALAGIDYKQIQSDLNRMGYKVGTADGIPGRNTKRGIRQFFSDAGYEAPESITEVEQSFINDVATFVDKPLELIRDVITNKISISSMTDEELCTVNFHIDLMPVFDELNSRVLNCPSGTEKVIRYEGQLINDPVEQLRKFQRTFDIRIPEFDLKNAQTFIDWDETKEIYNFLNPMIGQLVNQDGERLEYCSKFMGRIGSVPPDPSKNLDGTGSWAGDTMRDGFVICQDSLNALYLRALSSNEMIAERSRKAFQKIIEQLVEADGANNLPFRPYHKLHNKRAGRADPNFTYLITLSKLMTGVELLHSSFGWSQDDYAAYSDWAKERLIQRLPVGGRSSSLDGQKCNLNPSMNNMNDACMNAAPFLAQGLLRAAIMGGDRELAELSYLVFKQYSSAIRKDGSQSYDAIRHCYAANYTIWASEFLHDYVYLAAQAGMNLWEDQFSEKNGTPRKNVEYALKVRANPNLVNKYAKDFGFSDCKTENGQIVQKVANYPWSAFSFYLHSFDKTNFDNIFLEDRSDLWSYTGASGVNYEIDLLAKKTELIDYFTTNEARIFAEREQKEKDAAAAKRVALLESIGFDEITGDDPYAGRYTVTWYFVDSMRTKKSEEARDVLTLANGMGSFAGANFDMQPSSKFRKELFIAYNSLGDIFIQGNLDLFDVGRAFQTVLKGSLNINDKPEISGTWYEGDIFELEVKKID
jgi:hypothetical protein